MILKNGFKGCFIQWEGLMTWMRYWYFDSEGSLGVMGTICSKSATTKTGCHFRPNDFINFYVEVVPGWILKFFEYLLINLYRHSFCKGNLSRRREKLKLSLKGFQGPSAPAKAQPAFEANAFDLINLSRLGFSRNKRRRKLKT